MRTRQSRPIKTSSLAAEMVRLTRSEASTDFGLLQSFSTGLSYGCPAGEAAQRSPPPWHAVFLLLQGHWHWQGQGKGQGCLCRLQVRVGGRLVRIREEGDTGGGDLQRRSRGGGGAVALGLQAEI